MSLPVPAAASAQATRQASSEAIAAGRVLIPRAADTVPLAGARVLLHRVGRAAQGPVDSVLTDGGGGFRFRFRADTADLYLLSARHGGIEYFSPPVRTTPARPDTAIRLLAYDTSTTAPIAVGARHIVVTRPGPDGARPVLDLIVLRNDGVLARSVPDSTHPSWAMALPAGSGPMEVGESDLSPDAILRDGDSVKVVAPLAPGEKKLLLEYAVASPRGRLAFAVGPNPIEVNLLVEERGARVSGGALAVADSQMIEARSFRRWHGRVPAGGTIAVTFGAASRFSARQLLAGLVVPVAGALVFAAWQLLRGRSRPGSPESREQLLDLIAALDAHYAGRETETAAEDWRRYEAERAALKARL